MRILMLGNSLTSAQDMPDILAELTGAEVVCHTRGGARLSEHLNPNTRLGARTQAALAKEQWDYVVLQEMSHGPITAPGSFFASVERLCRQIRENGAIPVLYATWAYQKGGARLSAKGWRKTAPCLPTWGGGFTSCPARRTSTPPMASTPAGRGPALRRRP